MQYYLGSKYLLDLEEADGTMVFDASVLLFMDLAGGDYYLRVISPLIDAGDPDFALGDGNDTRNDIGAFGGPLAAASRYAAPGPVRRPRYQG